jgi:hypothetical protein
MRINSLTSVNNNRTNKNQTQKFGAVTDKGADYVYGIVQNNIKAKEYFFGLMERAFLNRDVHVDFYQPNGGDKVYMRLLNNDERPFPGFTPVKNGDAAEVIALLKAGVTAAEEKTTHLPLEILTDAYRIKRLSIKRSE